MLGPLDARRGERPLRLGGPKQKALLAVLLLHAREVVSSDRLIDALWGEHPPDDAHTALHAHVSRVRKALEVPGVLVTRAPGYALEIEDDQLDVRRFERLAAEGRRQLGDGDAAGAAATLRDALALWRGRPLADLEDEPFAATVAPALAEARLEAQETRVEADLARGQDAALVPELDALVRAHPLRERPRAQLMLALYRSGRQAEALATYDDGRRRLAEELGLEPGGRIRRLQAEILADEPGRQPGGRRTPPRRGGAGAAGGHGGDRTHGGAGGRSRPAASRRRRSLPERSRARGATETATPRRPAHAGRRARPARPAHGLRAPDGRRRPHARRRRRRRGRGVVDRRRRPDDLARGRGQRRGDDVRHRRDAGRPRGRSRRAVGGGRWPRGRHPGRRARRHDDRARRSRHAHGPRPDPPAAVRRRHERAGRGPGHGRGGRGVGDRPRLRGRADRSAQRPRSSRRSAACRPERWPRATAACGCSGSTARSPASTRIATGSPSAAACRRRRSRRSRSAPARPG